MLWTYEFKRNHVLSRYTSEKSSRLPRVKVIWEKVFRPLRRPVTTERVAVPVMMKMIIHCPVPKKQTQNKTLDFDASKIRSCRDVCNVLNRKPSNSITALNIASDAK